MGRQPPGAMWRYLVRLDQHPPLYYTLLHFWMRLGDGEAIVRGFSALWGILTLPVIYAIGARVGGRALGLLAMLILALSPMHVQYAQDARMYAMLTFFASVALLCAVQLLESPQNREPPGGYPPEGSIEHQLEKSGSRFLVLSSSHWRLGL